LSLSLVRANSSSSSAIFAFACASSFASPASPPLLTAAFLSRAM
jgi:hypothetical protein